jgi:hypothetical protein
VADEFDPVAFQLAVEARLAASRKAFAGLYSQELEQLLGLSRAEVDAIAPGVTDLQKYDELIAVVKEASQANLARADLRKHIEDLGKLAIDVSKKVPLLAGLFA